MSDKIKKAIEAARILLDDMHVEVHSDPKSLYAGIAARAVLSLADEVERLRRSVLRLEHELDEAQETIAMYVDEETEGGAS